VGSENGETETIAGRLIHLLLIALAVTPVVYLSLDVVDPFRSTASFVF
jgi:hypothetical protein